MNAAVHIVPALGVEADAARVASNSGCAGSGITHAALVTADRIDGPVDLVLVAVAAGRGDRFVAHLRQSGAIPW